MVRARFAPSPTGNLHIGSARTLIFNWLYVRKHRGTMILTINDTDVNRNTDASLQLAERIEAAPEFTEHSVEANLRKLAEERVVRRLRWI